MSNPEILAAALGALDSAGHALAARGAVLNVLTGALLGGALLVDRLVSRRVRASWRMAFYAPVALRVLLPLDWSLWSTPFAGAPPRFVALLAPLPVAGHAAAVPGSGFSLYALGALLYLAVAAALAARTVAARWRLGRALADARSVLWEHPGVRCPIVKHDELGPMVFGVLAPRIVIPARLLAAGEEHALACVVRHEAAHLRRGDGWLSAGLQVLAVVAWPVVPLWVAFARVRELIELACDEEALAGADAAARRRYGHALLDLAEWRSFPIAPLGAGELHFGGTLRARIEALACQRHWPAAAQALLLSIAPVALLAACGAATPSPAAPLAKEDYGYKFASDSSKEAPNARDVELPLAPGGRLPPETIQAAVRAHFPALQACYESGLKKDPRLAGTVTVKYEVGEDGVTIRAADEKSSLPDKDVVACVVGEFQKVRYPRSPGGMVTVLYPVEFAP